jgi:uncharacterized glyoxalase superfamily protein PhnB
MKPNRSMPPGVIIPELAYPSVPEAAAWLCETFGFVERLRIGDHRAQLSFGEGSIIVTRRQSDLSASFETAGRCGCTVMVRLSDVDRHYERVRQSTAQIIQEPGDFPYGERQYVVEDPGGHRWTFSETTADIDPQRWGGELM